MSDLRNSNNREPLVYKNIPYSCVLGDRRIGMYAYECRIFDYANHKLDRVLVYARHFGDVRWCMIGYTHRSLLISDTTMRNVKHLVMPDDVGQKLYSIIVIRNR